MSELDITTPWGLLAAAVTSCGICAAFWFGHYVGWSRYCSIRSIGEDVEWEKSIDAGKPHIYTIYFKISVIVLAIPIGPLLTLDNESIALFGSLALVLLYVILSFSIIYQVYKKYVLPESR